MTSAAVTELEVPTTLRLSGTLRGNQETDLAANAAGRVLATLVERGNQVSPNQVLARLDVRAAALSAAEARAQAETVTAQEENARRECARYEQLKAKGAVSDFEYERITDQCRTLPLSREAASARARLAAQNVGDGIIRAPFAGVVSERYVEVGQYVRQDTRVVSIASLDPLRLELSVPEAEVGRVKMGADISFRVAAYPDRKYHGTVRYMAGALRSSTRDLVVEALVENADKTLLPGMFADVELTTGTQKLPSVPSNALMNRDGQAHAFFVVEGRAEERILSLGPSVADRVSVQRGARVGDQVVVKPSESLANGQRVR
ncbi:MAG TPA: efflux RND transporter periplasmic adaptor subunit [Polyangiaceae bacterium]|nr:efflux RND transporter periplasmic adaptor subunit [Polyangiaceae bacterium]